MRTLTDSQLETQWDQAWEAVERTRKHKIAECFTLTKDHFTDEMGVEALLSEIFRSTVYGVHLNDVPDDAIIDWFGMEPVEHNGVRMLLPAPNLAVNTGLHITAQRAFNLTATSGTTSLAVTAGGVDSDATAVSATTSQASATSNTFVKAFDSTPTYSTANKRVTALFTIANTDYSGTGANIHRRYFLTNDTTVGANGGRTANSLFSMLSGFVLDFNGKAYSITIESQSNFTGS